MTRIDCEYVRKEETVSDSSPRQTDNEPNKTNKVDIGKKDNPSRTSHAPEKQETVSNSSPRQTDDEPDKIIKIYIGRKDNPPRTNHAPEKQEAVSDSSPRQTDNKPNKTNKTDIKRKRNPTRTSHVSQKGFDDRARQIRKKVACLYCSILGLIILGIFIWTLIDLECETWKRYQKSFCEKPIDEMRHIAASIPKSLFVQSDDKLLLYNPKTLNVTVIHESKKPIYDFDVHPISNSIFYTEYYPSKIQILTNVPACGLKYYILQTFEDPRVKPTGLAIDHLTDNLYFVDESMGALIVIKFFHVNSSKLVENAKIQPQKFTILTLSLNNPKKILLDPEERVIFILQRNNQVIRMSMDGSTQSRTIVGHGITAMTLGGRTEQIYWIKNDGSSGWSDYDGKNRSTLLMGNNRVSSLAVLDDRLFWLWRRYPNDAVTLWSCPVHGNNREKHFLQANPVSIKTKEAHNVTNSSSCEINNGGCQDLCLINNSERGRICACNIGFRLNSDLISCKKIEDFILYAQGNKIQTRDPYSNETTDVFLPTPFRNETFLYQDFFDFDYDLRNDDLYLSYETHIDKIKLKTYEKQTTVLTSARPDFIFGHIAYDWSTGNLYYVRRSKTSSFPHSIMVLNPTLGPEHQKTLATFRYHDTLNDGCPFGLVLHPNRNYLVYSVKNDKYSLLLTSWMSHGFTSHLKMRNFVTNKPSAIDYAENKVYRIVDQEGNSTEIVYSYPDGADEKNIFVGLKSVVNIYIHQQYMYLSTSDSIWRASKYDGSKLSVINVKKDFRDISRMKFVSSSIQSVDASNRCLVNNGYCEQFCFPGPNLSCACSDGVLLQADMKSCF